MLIMQNWDFSGTWMVVWYGNKQVRPSEQGVSASRWLDYSAGTDHAPDESLLDTFANASIKIFFQKSEFVTFLDLLKANLMQKIRKN